MKTIAATMVALSLTVGFAGHASAQTSGTGAAIVCEKDYKAFWDRMSALGAKPMSGKELADVSRVALRGYDACTSGDQRFNAKDFFDKLGASGSKPEDILKSIDGLGAKK